jgi:hypothetical protein
MFKKITLSLLLIATAQAAHANETCANMGTVATNFASAAYQLTADDFDAIDRMGFFNAWMMYLGLLLEDSYKQKIHSNEFFLSAQIAGVSMKQEKDSIKDLSSKDYKLLFPRIVVRACEVVRSDRSKGVTRE